MKKILILILILCISIQTFSQRNIGIEAGITVSTLYSSNESSGPKPAFGPRAGINYKIPLTNWLDIETGLYYMQKGLKEHTESKGSTGDNTPTITKNTNKYKLNYLELPLNLKIKFGNWFIYGGPYFSYGIKLNYIQKYATRNAETDAIIVRYKYKNDIYHKTYSSWNERFAEKYDYGVNFGIGYQLKYFSIKTGFDLGLYDAVKSYPEVMAYPEYNKYKNRTVYVSLTYNPLLKKPKIKDTDIIQSQAFIKNAFEIETGLNVSTNSPDGLGSFENPALGPRIGINYLRRITSWLDIETGLYYTQKVDKYKKEGSGANSEGILTKVVQTDKYKYNYIELPLNLKFKIHKWFIYSGFYISYPTSIYLSRKNVATNAETGDFLWKNKIRSEVNYNQLNPEFYSKSIEKTFDYGPTIGFGRDFNKFRLKLGAEYGFEDKFATSYLTLAYQFNSFNKIEIKKTDTLFNQKNGFLMSFELSDYKRTTISSIIGFKQKKAVYFVGYERLIYVSDLYLTKLDNLANRVKIGIYLYPHKNLGNLKVYYQSYFSYKWYDSVNYPQSSLFHLGLGFDYFIIKNLALGFQGNIGYGKIVDPYTTTWKIGDKQIGFTAKYFLTW